MGLSPQHILVAKSEKTKTKVLSVRMNLWRSSNNHEGITNEKMNC